MTTLYKLTNLSMEEARMIYYFLWMLFWHLIADFVLQTHWQAINKSKNWIALFSHVSVYSAVMTLAFVGVGWHISAVGLLPVFCWSWSITFVTHFCTDAITSRINARLWAAQKVHWFFVGVGTDQFVHQVTIASTMLWVMQ